MKTVQVGFRMPVKLHKLLTKVAEHEGRTMSNLIIYILKDFVMKKSEESLLAYYQWEEDDDREVQDSV